MKTLWIATGNQGKLREFRALLEPLGFTVWGLGHFTHVYPNRPPPKEIIEDGDSFAANAVKKAQSLADYLDTSVVADDSGLVVDALNGAPGIFSARYAAEHFSAEPDHDKANRDKLLHALMNVSPPQRTAHFVCALALCTPNTAPKVFESTWQGHIAQDCRGAGGFGYDPIFLVAGDAKGRTSAELSATEKNRCSHRAQALRLLRNSLH